MVKLNIVNLYELKNHYKTETANYIYTARPCGINVYQLLRKHKTSMTNSKVEAVRMPEIYRGFFKKWRWLD